MTNRDKFAAAALTGLLAAPTDKYRSMDYWARLSYEAADAMLARRPCVTEPMPVAVSGSGSVTPVPYVKHDEKRVDWHTAGGTNHDAAPAAKASKCGGTSHDAVGTGDSFSSAEIDALQHVVEDGRIVKMQDYGALRSLLVSLRPEWEGDGDSDRPKPINDERLAALEQLSALDQELELEYGLTGNPLIKARRCKAAKTDTTQPPNGTPAKGSVQGVGSVPDSRNANEPVAWGVMRVGGGWVSILGNALQAETSRQSFDKTENWVHEIAPLYRQPQPTFTDAEREAIKVAAGCMGMWMIENGVAEDGSMGRAATTMRGLLERLR